MRLRNYLTAAALIAATVGIWSLMRDGPARSKVAAKTSTAAVPAADRVLGDPALVFQKAFWKRPTSDDRILHAERREWTEDGETSRWQWFIEVEASPALERHLITQNAFGLGRSAAPVIPGGAPAWFTANPQGAVVMTAAGGTMQLIFHPETRRLHACGAGGGFRKGAPEQAKCLPQPMASTSRIPSTPPPRPASR